MEANLIQKQQALQEQTPKSSLSINALMNSILDGEGMRKRFEELLGKRTPQFISSLISMINADINLQQAFREAPMTVIQAALRAASYDLPIDPVLGFAYIVPFRNTVKDAAGKTSKRMEATFIPGYKGLVQLCLRTGVYKNIPDSTDVREGELICNDRLKGPVFKWTDDETERDKLQVIGYAASFTLLNGAEKTIYMTVDQIKAHEKKHRKGEYMSKGWREDFDSMARKTVLRRLISKYGLMSIDYRSEADDQSLKLAEAIAAEGGDIETIETDYIISDYNEDLRTEPEE